jgi:hypothetical protein
VSRVRPGAPWGEPSAAEPDLDVRGGDADLARAIREAPGALIRFEPDATSDIARSVGLVAGAPLRHVEVVMDALRVSDGRIAVNMIIAGRPPATLHTWHRSRDLGVAGGPALCVVLAVGQYHHGLDLVPRGHPGDGRAELHTYRLRPGQRGALQHRLPTGSHLPHPSIATSSVRALHLAASRPFPVEVDGVDAGRTASLQVAVVAGAYRLLL